MLPLPVDIDKCVSDVDIILWCLNDVGWLPYTSRCKSWTPIPPEIILLLSDVFSIRKFVQLLNAKGPGYSNIRDVLFVLELTYFLGPELLG